jgi:hypothetical protein
MSMHDFGHTAAGFKKWCFMVLITNSASGLVSRSKNIRLSQQNYMEIGTLILKGIENMNITSKECYHQLAPDLKICLFDINCLFFRLNLITRYL